MPEQWLIGLGLLLGTLLRLSSLEVGLVPTVVTLQGVIILIVGILYLAVGIGFLGRKRWSWTLGIIVSVIGIILNIVRLAFGNYGVVFLSSIIRFLLINESILSLIISLLILYYLMRPHVKAFFGKGPPMGDLMPPPPPPSTM